MSGKVALLGMAYPPNIVGGLDTFVIELYERLQSSSWDVTLVVDEEQAPDDEPDVRGIPLEMENQSIVDAYRDASDAFADIAADCDIVHTQDYFGYFPGRRATRDSEATWLTTVLATQEQVKQRSNPYTEQKRETEQRLMKECDEVVAISELVADIVRSNYDRDPDVVPLAFDSCDPTGADVRADLELDDDEEFVFFVGRHVERKGLFYLLEAFDQVADDRDATLVVAGRGPDTPYAKRLANVLDLGESVQFIGFVPYEELGDYFEAADVFVSPCRSEPFGFTITEALEQDTPVVAGENGAEELLPDDVVVTVERDIEEIAHGIERALDRDGVPEYDTRTWEECTEDFIELYDELLAS